MSLCVFGEGMLELSGIRDGAARFGYGGDALNTAIHLARLGASPQFVSALGDDPHSVWLREEWSSEGLLLDHCLTVKGGIPGLYAISVDDHGERSFTYWRSESAARSFFSQPDTERAVDAMLGASLLYLTGITLSIFGKDHQRRIIDLMRSARAGGAEVAFDLNYRPKGWPLIGDARAIIGQAIDNASICFVSLEDWTLLHGAADAASIADELSERGCAEAIVKDGARGCYLKSEGVREWAPAREVKKPVDTTGAGDGFNAAYLAARLKDASPLEACAAGNDLAGAVIQHTGAIGPKQLR